MPTAESWQQALTVHGKTWVSTLKLNSRARPNNSTADQGWTDPREEELGVQGWCQTHTTCQNMPEHSSMCQNVQDHPVLSRSLSKCTEKSRANRKESVGSNAKNRLPGQGCGSVTASLPIAYKVLGSIPAWQGKIREQLPTSLSQFLVNSKRKHEGVEGNSICTHSYKTGSTRPPISQVNLNQTHKTP